MSCSTAPISGVSRSRKLRTAPSTRRAPVGGLTPPQRRADARLPVGAARHLRPRPDADGGGLHRLPDVHVGMAGHEHVRPGHLLGRAGLLRCPRRGGRPGSRGAAAGRAERGHGRGEVVHPVHGLDDDALHPQVVAPHPLHELGVVQALHPDARRPRGAGGVPDDLDRARRRPGGPLRRPLRARRAWRPRPRRGTPPGAAGRPDGRRGGLPASPPGCRRRRRLRRTRSPASSTTIPASAATSGIALRVTRRMPSAVNTPAVIVTSHSRCFYRRGPARSVAATRPPTRDLRRSDGVGRRCRRGPPWPSLTACPAPPRRSPCGPPHGSWEPRPPTTSSTRSRRGPTRTTSRRPTSSPPPPPTCRCPARR